MLASCRNVANGILPERGIGLHLRHIQMPVKRPRHPVPEGGNNKTNDDEFIEHHKKTGIQKNSSPYPIKHMPVKSDADTEQLPTFWLSAHIS